MVWLPQGKLQCLDADPMPDSYAWTPCARDSGDSKPHKRFEAEKSTGTKFNTQSPVLSKFWIIFVWLGKNILPIVFHLHAKAGLVLP